MELSKNTNTVPVVYTVSVVTLRTYIGWTIVLKKLGQAAALFLLCPNKQKYTTHTLVPVKG